MHIHFSYAHFSSSFLFVSLFIRFSLAFAEKTPNGPREIWNFWLKSTFVHCLDFNENTNCDETKPKWLTLSRWRCAKNSENGENSRVSFGLARNPTALCKSIFTPEIQTGNMKDNLFIAHSLLNGIRDEFETLFIVWMGLSWALRCWATNQWHASNAKMTLRHGNSQDHDNTTESTVIYLNKTNGKHFEWQLGLVNSLEWHCFGV